MEHTPNDPGLWTEEELSLLEAAVRIQGSNNRVSCLAAVGLGKPCVKVLLTYIYVANTKVHAKIAAKKLLPASATTTTTTTTTATTTITTTISEQSRPSSSSRHSRSMSVESSTTKNQTQAQHVHVHKKRKTAFGSKSSKKESRMEYPADCALSADNEKRSKFTPCDHEGPCGAGCPCVEDQVHCEKACACPLVRFPCPKC